MFHSYKKIIPGVKPLKINLPTNALLLIIILIRSKLSVTSVICLMYSCVTVFSLFTSFVS